MRAAQVLKGGLLTTVQDLGRYGYQAFGMPVSGAMDTLSLRLANLLAGNQQGEAALEITMVGPSLRFLSSTVIALTGADLSPMIDGNPMPMWVNYPVKEGSILSFGRWKTGCRAYLSVSGGWAVEPVMGSLSTYLRGQLGGHLGRALKAGDVLDFYRGKSFQELGYRALNPGMVPQYDKHVKVRAIPGPQVEYFSLEVLRQFFSDSYRVSRLADRMGYRLEGTRLERSQNQEMISDATALGAIQVPADGQPIVLMADRQTTGGYPKIATVIFADIPKLAQAQTGDEIRFEECDVRTAQKILRQQENAILTGILQGKEGEQAWVANALNQRGKIVFQMVDASRKLFQIQIEKSESLHLEQEPVIMPGIIE